MALAGCGEKSEPAPKASSSLAGGGDEQPIRQRVTFTVGKHSIRPAQAQVDAFLGIRLIVRNASGRAQRIEVRGGAVRVARGLRANLDLEGLRPGRYRIQGEPTKAHATLVVRRSTP